jgi:ElaB/YqjD/DUF883 family membrane-anchored ribosome-binding protein
MEVPMFRQRRAAKAQSAAEDAWDALVSAWESARDRTGDLVEGTQDRVGSVTDQARRRASAALDALAGRRPPQPWALLATVAAAGAALGWVLAAAVGRAPHVSAIGGGRDTSPADVTPPTSVTDRGIGDVRPPAGP